MRNWRTGGPPRATILAVAIAASMALPAAASAFVIAYGGYNGVQTAAHSYRYQGDRHTWKDNTVSYPGTASFGICTVLKGYYDRVNYAGPYCASNNVRRRVIYYGGYTGYMDAGIGNQDHIARYVYGCADTNVWEVYPC